MVKKTSSKKKKKPVKKKILKKTKKSVKAKKKKPTRKVVKKKKPVKKKTLKTKHKKKPTEVHYHSTKEIKVEKALIDNFIGFQKVMLNLSEKFDDLSKQISSLLNLFEISAKAMAKKEFAKEKDPELKKVLDKIDNLGEQAGLIGKGLALIHEVNEEKPHEIRAPAPLLRAPGPMNPSMQRSPQMQNPQKPHTMMPSIHEKPPQMQNPQKPPLEIPSPRPKTSTQTKPILKSKKTIEIGEQP